MKESKDQIRKPQPVDYQRKRAADKDKDSREDKDKEKGGEEQQVERGSDGEPWSCLVEKGGGRGNDGAG